MQWLGPSAALRSARLDRTQRLWKSRIPQRFATTVFLDSCDSESDWLCPVPVPKIPGYYVVATWKMERRLWALTSLDDVRRQEVTATAGHPRKRMGTWHVVAFHLSRSCAHLQ